MGRERGRREREEDERRHRERMEVFLAAASSRVKEREAEGDIRQSVNRNEMKKSPASSERQTATETSGQSGKRAPQPIMWQTARKHVVS